MTAETMSVKALFDRALEIEDPQQRQAYLDQTCADNVELRSKVDNLLKAYHDAGSFLESVPANLAATVNVPGILEGPGAVIGHYKLLQQVGEGGFGVVYMAEQQEPVRRKVALKIIKPGMDSRQVIARFEAERQALAIMDHQNIARVLDAGTTDAGRPYFVMELVKGVAITEYCNSNKLTPRERLELFIPVCQAIQHAHQKGVIHRDIKPSNVLVCLYDGKPVPKVIDFGVAKAIEQRLTEKTMFTQHGQVIGTLEYMSPEQAEMSQLDIDTRSDIYSLGVLLYELLTGGTPITKQQLRSTGFVEMLRMIREAEPEKPSLRLSHSADALPTISAQRRTEPSKLGQLLRGDLDWIVMKSLEKDRTRRYESAHDLARDIERYLHDEPVEAGPPRVIYRCRKFVRRHRAGVFIALFVPATVAAVLFNHFVGHFRLQDAQRSAVAERNRALAALEETRRQMDRAADAEQQAVRERDRATDAERATRDQQILESQAREETQDLLARSLFNQAVAVRGSSQSGRSWQSLQLLQQAEKLRARKRSVAPSPPPEGARLDSQLPTSAELRSAAVAAWQVEDARVTWALDTPLGMQPGVSADGRRVIAVRMDPSMQNAAIRLVDARDGRELQRWEGQRMGPMIGTALALSPDGKRLASGGGPNRHGISVWDLASGERIQVLNWPGQRGAEGQPRPDEPAGNGVRKPTPPDSLPTGGDLAFSPDGRHVAAFRRPVPGSQPNPSSPASDTEKKDNPDQVPLAKGERAATIVLWDVEAGGEPQILTAVGGAFEPAWTWFTFTSDGRWLAFPTGQQKVTVWSIEKQEQVLEIELPEPILGRAAFDVRTQLLAIPCGPIGSKQGQILVWDLVRNVQQHHLQSEFALFTAQLAFSPDGSELAVGNAEGRITIFDVPEERVAVRLDQAHQGMVNLVRWDIDGRHLLSYGLEGSFKCWELPGDRLISRLDIGKHRAFAFAFSPDGKWLATSSGPQNTLCLINRSTGAVEREFVANGFPLFEIVFSDDSRQFAQIGSEQAVIWDVGTGREVARLEKKDGLAGQMLSAAFTRTGQLMVSVMDMKTQKLSVWDVAVGKKIWQAPAEAVASVGSFGILSPDGKLLATIPFIQRSGKHDPLTVWELPAGRKLSQLVLAGNGAVFPRFSPDGRWLVSLDPSNSFGSVLFGRMGGRSALTADTQVVVQSLTQPIKFKVAGASAPDTFAISPDSRLLAIGYRDGTVQVWSIERAEELFRYSPGPLPVSNLAFTPDGTGLASSNEQSQSIDLLHLADLRRRLTELGLDQPHK